MSTSWVCLLYFTRSAVIDSSLFSCSSPFIAFVRACTRTSSLISCENAKKPKLHFHLILSCTRKTKYRSEIVIFLRNQFLRLFIHHFFLLLTKSCARKRQQWFFFILSIEWNNPEIPQFKKAISLHENFSLNSFSMRSNNKSLRHNQDRFSGYKNLFFEFSLFTFFINRRKFAFF